MSAQHWAIFINNESHKGEFIRRLLNGNPPNELEEFTKLHGVLYSKLAIEQFIDKEDRHGTKIITKDSQQSLQSMSSGEQKKALLNYLFQTKPDYLILDNPFDNLDIASQKKLGDKLTENSTRTIFVSIISRKNDLLPFIKNYASLNKSKLSVHKDLSFLIDHKIEVPFSGKIPGALKKITCKSNDLVALKNIHVKFGDKTVLQNINWTIKKGEFWQLIGKNGSGKTTILSMITGENPKGYGQNLFLFGHKKGSGESIWDIKRYIGYFTPAMTDKFTGYHSVENMLISGLNDSIGLYIRPTEIQLRLAKQWLLLIDMWTIKDQRFHDLTMGQKRLVMTVRAMIKHPLLLILDEPTAGLDDASAELLVALVNKIARESEVATIFVSHRKEPGLEPDHTYELKMTKNGAIGLVK